MTLQYKFELDDSVAFNRHFMFKSNYGRRSRRRAFMWIVVISFSVVYMVAHDQPLTQWVALASSLSVVLCGGYLLSLPRMVRRAITSMHASQASTQPFGDRRLSLEPTGAREVSDHAETFASFESMSDPVETTTHVFIMINPLLGFVIPKAKVFSGSLTEFLTALKAARQATLSARGGSGLSHAPPQSQ